MKRMLLMAPNPNDATSWWRAYGPFAHLDRSMKTDWEVIPCKVRDVAWSDFVGVDLVFLQRPCRDIHKDLIEMARDLGVPVWVDWDDDFMSVPYSNPAHEAFAGQEIADNLEWIAKNASAVSVSTHRLKAIYEKWNQRTVLIPNAWNPTICPPRRPHKAEGRFILWRGTKTHDEDIETYIDQMVAVSEKHPDWHWMFIGDPHWKVVKHIKKHIVLKGYNVHRYHTLLGNLADQQPSVAIVPLAPSPFNEAKSNIAWIEAAFAGAATLAPNMTEWRRASVSLYGTPQEFEQGLNFLIESSAENRSAICEAAWQDVLQNFWMDSVNQRRHTLMEELYLERRHIRQTRHPCP